MYYAEQGKSEKALENLQKAVSLGYSNLDWFETDSSIDILRDDPRFISIIQSLEEQVKVK